MKKRRNKLNEFPKLPDGAKTFDDLDCEEAEGFRIGDEVISPLLGSKTEGPGRIENIGWDFEEADFMASVDLDEAQCQGCIFAVVPLSELRHK